MNTTTTQPVVLITGAGEPTGRALALAFARAGYWVAANDRTPVHLDCTVEQVQAAGGVARAYIYETNKGLPARELVDDVLADWNRIDVLVNALTVCPPAALLRLDEWDWQHTLEVNLSGPLLLIQLVSRLMHEQGGGAVLTCVDAQAGVGTSPAYAITMAARAALTAAVRPELLAYNIHIFDLQPGETGETGSDLRQWAVQAVEQVSGSFRQPG